ALRDPRAPVQKHGQAREPHHAQPEHTPCQEAQQEGPEEDAGQQRQGHECTAEAIKALVKPKEVKPKIPKGRARKLSQLAYTAHPKLGKRARAHIAKGLRLCWPKSQAKAAAARAAAAPAPAPKGAQAPTKARVEAFICQ
ncbi:hypothetical protein E2I00_011824, partial [Balaenoptera physalus]